MGERADAHLLDGLDNLLEIEFGAEPRHCRDRLAPIALLNTEVDGIGLLRRVRVLLLRLLLLYGIIKGVTTTTKSKIVGVHATKEDRACEGRRDTRPPRHRGWCAGGAWRSTRGSAAALRGRAASFTSQDQRSVDAPQMAICMGVHQCGGSHWCGTTPTRAASQQRAPCVCADRLLGASQASGELSARAAASSRSDDGR